MQHPEPQTNNSNSETPPVRVACVDTGSNGIRFQAAEISDSQSYTTLDYERVPIRLGHQVFLDGRLANDAIDDTVRAFASFRERMDSLGIVHYRAIATSAVREAKNRAILVDRLERETDIKLEVITGSEEARLVHLAVASRIDLSGGKWILVDLGGGSVEISLVDDSGMLWSESHTMGSVRLLEELSGVDNEPGKLRRLFSEYISVLRIPAPAQYWEPSGFIATGGNIESLAELASAKEDDSGVAHLPLKDLDSAIDLLSKMPYNERMTKLNLRADRADVILPASLVYERLARLSRVDEILVPHIGVKDGLIIDTAETLFLADSNELRHERQILQAAASLGRRYMFDEAHGKHVADLAGSIFDQLQSLHGRSPHDRLLLKCAGVLHDVGIFVALKSHHKHSLYIISRSEIPGLTQSDMILIAHISRYHRGNPSRHHQEYMALSASDQVRVSQLAALLKIANGLDRQHVQAVRDVDVEVVGSNLDIRITGEGDLLLEKWAVSRKTRLLKDTFGLGVQIEVTEAELPAAQNGN